LVAQFVESEDANPQTTDLTNTATIVPGLANVDSALIESFTTNDIDLNAIFVYSAFVIAMSAKYHTDVEDAIVY
jgi:hypothetical protein